jgi:arylsulfatase A-like enzyme
VSRPSIIRSPPRQRAALFGLLWGAGWFLAEAAYLAFAEPDVRAWSVPLSVGVGAPIALFSGAFMLALFITWNEMTWWVERRENWPKRLATWAYSGDPERLARRTAGGLSGVLVLCVWSLVVMLVDIRIGATVNTPSLAAGLSVLVSLITALGLALSAPLVVVPMSRLLGWASTKGRYGAMVARPATWLVAFMAVGLLALLVLRVRFADVWMHLPWVFVVGPLGGLAIAALGARWAGARSSNPGRALAGFMLALAVLFSVALFLPDGLRDGRRIFTGHQSLARTWMHTMTPWLDHDDDGSLSYFGGQDCAPYNAAIGPRQQEIANNGIDEDCTGADVAMDLSPFKQGPRSHPKPSGIAKRPHIILVTTDALSAPHTTLGGYERDTTPRLAEWAKRATVFSEAFGTSCSTRLSLTAIVTGHYNAMVRLQDRKKHPFFYDPSVQTTASMLKTLGYHTVHIPGAAYFTSAKWGGYWGGFDVVDETSHRKGPTPQHSAAEITNAALDHIDGAKDSAEPLFLWVHYFDHHHPYENPKGGKRFGKAKSELDRYDAELYHADQHWGRLLERIESTWSPEDYVVVFTSDHGEAFDKNHPKEHHDFSLFTEVLRVPLIIQSPWRRGETITGLASHLDIVPTLASIVGAAPDSLWQGESLVGVLTEGKPIEKQAVYSLFYIPEAVKRNKDPFEMIGVRTATHYYVADYRKDERWFVEWTTDPLDSHDITDQDSANQAIYASVLAGQLQWLKEHEQGLNHVRKSK